MNQVRKFAFAYLYRKISIEDFLDWISDATSPAINLAIESNEKALANEIYGRAAELTGGYISEDRFRMYLLDLVGNIRMITAFSDQQKFPAWETAATKASVTAPVESLAVHV